MQIDEVEIHEFTYQLEDVGTRDGHQIYEPGSVVTPPGFILTIRTESGLKGHYRGFMYTPPMVTQIKMAAPEFLIGRDPLEREAIWQDLWHAFRHTDHLGVGPIDIALWDLAGKYYDESISKLLGGSGDQVSAYASTYHPDYSDDGLNSPAAFAEFARQCRKDGYKAFKIHPYGDPQQDIEICRAVAEEVGDEMDLMLDPASEYQTYAETVEVGHVLDDLDFFWYEDPMADTGQSVHMGRQLKNKLRTPLLGVEHSRTGPFGRVNHLEGEALELVRGDAHMDGGITGVMKIANIAEAFGSDTELHVGGPAHLHCMSAIRNTNYFEHGLKHPKVGWMADQGFQGQVEQVENGNITVPNGPGLGVDIDWAFVSNRTQTQTLIDEQGSSGVT